MRVADCFGGAAEFEAIPAGTAMCAHGDEFGPFLLRDLQDRYFRNPDKQLMPGRYPDGLPHDEPCGPIQAELWSSMARGSAGLPHGNREGP